MPMANKVNFEVGFSLNKAGLNELKNEFANIQRMTTASFQEMNKGKLDLDFSEATQRLVGIKDRALEIQRALEIAFNPKMNTINVSTFNKELQKSHIDARQLTEDFQYLGPAGQTSFRQIVNGMTTFNAQTKETSQLLDKMGQSLANTVKWGISSSIFNSITSSLQHAWDYTVKLNGALNDIRIVTNKSADDMNNFAVQANKAAQALGASTRDYAEASLIYYQQGLPEDVVKERTDVTLKTANVTGQDAADVSEQLTAIWNGYKVSAEESELYIDKVAKVAAATAADLEELSTGMSKVASAANSAGVDIDQLNAMLATVISVTREAPETIGTSFRSIFARMGDLAVDGEDEFGVSLGKVSGTLEQMGVQILDQKGDMRDMGDIVTDLAGKWEGWTRAQRQSAAVAIAGKQQYSRLIALMDNWDQYEQALSVSEGAMGTLQEQQDIYMDRTQAHLQQLSTAWERVYDGFQDDSGINSLIDGVTLLVQGFANFIEAVGGGGKALGTFGAIALNVFSNTITKELNTFISQIQTSKQNVEELDAVTRNLKGFQNLDINDKVTQDILKINKTMAQNANVISDEQREATKQLEEEYIKIASIKDEWAAAKQEALNYINAIMDTNYESYDQFRPERSKNEKGETGTNITDDASADIRNKLEEQAELVTNINNASSQYSKNMERVVQHTVSSNDEYKAIRSNLKDVTSYGENLQNTLRKMGKPSDALTTALNNVKKDMQELGKQKNPKALENFLTNSENIEKFKDDFDQLTSAMQKNSSVISDATSKTSDVMDQEFDEVRNKTEEVETDYQNMVDAIEEKLNRLQELNKTRLFVDLAGSIASIASGINSITNIPNIFNNEDLSVGEKLLQTIMALSTGLPMVISGFGKFKESIMGMAEARQLQAAVEAEATTATTVLTAAEEASAGASIGVGEASGVAAAGEALEGTAAGAATAPTLTFASALWAVLAPLLPFIGIAAAVGAALYGLVKAYNADADAAKEAAEQAKETQEQYEQIKTSYQDLVSAISDYGDAVNALNDLEKGTLEWKQAVLELNEQIIELVDKYPELAQFMTNKDGVLGLTESGINQVLENQWQRTQGAYRASNYTQMEANDKQFTSDLTDYVRGVMYTNTSHQYTGYSDETSVVRTMSKEQGEALIEALQNNGLSILQNEESLRAATGFNKELANAVLKDRTAVEELNSTLVKNINSNDALREATVQSYLITKKGDSGFNKLSGDDQSKVISAIADEYKNTDIEQWTKKGGDYDAGVFGWSWLGGGKSDKDIQKEYAKMMGYDTDNIDDKTGKAVYKNSDDEDVEVSDKVARAALAQEAALQKAAESTGRYVDVLNTMTDAGNAAAQNLQLLGTEYDNTASILKSGFQGNFDFSSATDDQLQALSNLRSSDQWENISSGYKEAGYDSADAFNAAFDEQMAKWNTPEKSAERARNLAAITEEQFNAALAKDAEALDVSESALRSYTEHLMDTNEALKEDKLLAEQVAVASFEFAEGVEELGEALDDNYELLHDWKKGLTDSTEAYEAIGAVQDAIEKMFNIRVSEDFVKDHLEDLEKLANGDVSALESLQEAAAKDYVAHLTINADDTRVQEIKNELDGYIDEFSQKDIQVGATIDDTDFINALNNMISSGEMTSEQVQEYLNSMGYEPEFEEESANTPPQSIDAETVVRFDPGGAGGLVGEMQLGTLKTSSTVNGITATMFGIKNAGTSGSGNKIKSIKKVSDTGSKAKAVKNSGGSGKKVTPPKNSGSGKKGSGSEKDPDKMDALEEEADRYHEIDTDIKLIETDLDRIEKKKKKAFGADLINLLNQQLQKLDKQMDNYNKKLQIANQEQAELRSKLSGKGVSFDADGTISNYMQAFAAQQAYVNSLIAQYNSMSADAQEGFKDTVEKAQEDFEKFKEDMDRYDELVSDTIPGLQDSIQDAIDEKIELQIEKFNMEIEIRLDLAEAERDWNEFKKKVIDGIKEDDILGNARARLQDFYSYYKEDNTGVVQANTQHVNDILGQLQQMDRTGTSDVYGDNRKQALEDLKTYYEQLMQDLEDIVDLQEEVHEAYLDMMDEAADKFADQLDTYEQISDLIQHDMRVIELVFGEEDYKSLDEYYKKQEQNYNQQLDFQRQQVKFWEDQMKAADEGSDEWQKAKEEWMSAVSDWNSTVEDAIENLQDKYLNAINLIFQELNDKVTNGMGLDYVGEEWELINQNADQYLDTINAMYGIRDLEKKYQDAIDNTDSVSAQRRLNDLMNEEVKKLQEKDKLTQYDVDRAEMRYQIALKQIALEEAQQSKSSMRLRRDSQGNYSYQFTADDDAIGQAEDELSQLQNELYNFDLEHYRDNLDQMYNIWTEYQEKMAEAAQINDPEQRAEREALLQEQYGELINGLIDQNVTLRTNLYESGFTELADLYDVDLSNFMNLSDQEKEVLMSDMIPQWDSGVQQMTDKFAGEGGFYPTCKDAMDKLSEATKDYEGSLQQLQSSAGQNFDEIRRGEDETIQKTQELLLDNQQLIQKYYDEMNAVRQLMAELQALVNQYKAAEAAAIAATQAAYGYWTAQNRQAAAAASNNGGGGGSSSAGSGGGGGSGSGGGGGQGDGIASVGDTATFTGKYYYDSYGTSPAGNRYSGVSNGVVIDKVNNNPYGIHIHSADGKFPDLGWVKKSQLTGYDTGGFTGNWGDEEGRLALLHKKELVLNKTDTANLLNAMEIMREISTQVNLRNQSLLSAVNAQQAAPAATNDTLEQNVHIEANFPNVQSHTEIETAIENLVNVASQRVYRREK